MLTTEKIRTIYPESTVLEALNALDCGVALADCQGRVHFWNTWLEQTTGIGAASACASNLWDLVAGLRGVALCQAVSAVANNPGHPELEPGRTCAVALPRVDGGETLHRVVVKQTSSLDTSAVCLLQFTAMSGGANTAAKLVGDSEYAPRLGEALDDAKHLRREQLRSRAVLASISDGVITLDVHSRVESMNLVAEQLTGWKCAEARGRLLDEVFHVENQANVAPGSREPELVLVGTHGAQFPVEVSVTPIECPDGSDLGMVVVFRDLTHSRKMAAQLVWQANHDPLTGLENRSRFDERLARLLSSAHRGSTHALLYLDLDQFKIVNDTCGHVAGDELLRRLTKVLKYKVRTTDVIARLGGDEFGILLENCSLDHAKALANELRSLVNEFRFTWGDKLFAVGISIGLVPIDENSKDASSVMVSADAACYAAKEGGRNRVHVFEPEVSVAAQRHGEMQWISRIHGALEGNHLGLYCQQIMSLTDDVSQRSHVEVLVRMHDPERGMVPPGAFIPAAERYNLMPMVDRWVVGSVFKYLSWRLKQDGTDVPHFNINLSGASLVQEGFLEYVLQGLESFRIPPQIICFEITETAAIANLDEAVNFINTLKDVGCQFALDDFGSGLSSFGYLKYLPVDYLKIDGAFIKQLGTNHIHRAMVDAINRLGHVMGIKTVAEFVGDEQTLEVLREIGVDYAQGYHINEPYELPLPPVG